MRITRQFAGGFRHFDCTKARIDIFRKEKLDDAFRCGLGASSNRGQGEVAKDQAGVYERTAKSSAQQSPEGRLSNVCETID
jgi:hypothetical protein